MYDSLLDEVLTEYYEQEFSKYSDAPEHRFSLKHRFALKKIFKLYEENTKCLRPRSSQKFVSTSKIRFTPKGVLILVLMIFLAALVGCAAAYFISQSFQGEVKKDYTNIFLINTESSPTVIEEKYYLSKLPDGFELVDTDSTPFQEYVCYENKHTNQYISLTQWVKLEFGTYHLNTEGHKPEEIDINGHNGLYIDFTNDKRTHSLVLWDNDDYILEISAELPKNETTDLAKSTKILEKQKNLLTIFR